MDSPKFNNAEIRRECKVISEKIQSMHNRVSEMLVGRKARIISDFNGQACGQSKPSLKGKVITVKIYRLMITVAKFGMVIMTMFIS